VDNFKLAWRDYMENIQTIIRSLSKEAKNIFSIIQKRGPISKNQLLEITSLKLTTLNRIIEPIENLKLINECGIGESSGGRKPILYDVSSNNYCIVGIDISRTYTQIVLVDLKMNILFKEKFYMDEGCTPDKTISIISEIITTAIIKLEIDKNSILGIGIGAVGPIDRTNGILINPINFIAEGWENVQLKKDLIEKTNLYVTVDNGANTAVLGEYFFGVGKGFKSTAYFNCGVGIRTGVINEGGLLRTINDAEDSFAHMIVDLDGDRCSCGNYGCVEVYSSIPSIIKKFSEEIKSGRESKLSKDIEKISYLDICVAAENEDTLAKEVIINAATCFGVGLSNFISLLNPEAIILSGPLINHSNLFYNTCKEVACKKHYLQHNNTVFFNKEGFFKEESIAVGAAAMILEDTLK
jgi:predicted NBD/HSP70 family sugar kinase